MKKGTIILITMLAAAAVAIGFGLYVMRQRINSPVSSSQQPAPDANQTQTQTQAQQQADQTPAAPLSSIVGWKTYSNDKHGFTVQYPSYLKAGAVSGNSVLGTATVPVKGLHVGPLVLVALEDKDLQKQAQDYFDGFYNAPIPVQTKNSPSAGTGDGQGTPQCTHDNITNNHVVSIKSVSCNGEGGTERYAYITGKTYSVFVDGYSKGFDNSGSGDFTNTTDYATILSTFIFTKDQPVTTTNNSPTPTPNPTPTGGPIPNPTPNPNPTPTPNPTPSIQTFSITADDSSATPSTITVPAGTIVEITFNVASSNVYHGGLDFRSSVVNSGTVYAGASKTISFTANQSFDFTPYWPASNVAKSYMISVMVQ
jgi:hypothetical protein